MLVDLQFLGEAAGAQTVKLLPQRLDDVGLVLLRLAPQVLLQVLVVQRRPQRVAGVGRSARQAPRLDESSVLSGRGRGAAVPLPRPVPLCFALVLRADLDVVVVLLPVVLEVGQVVLGGAPSRIAVQDRDLLAVV